MVTGFYEKSYNLNYKTMKNIFLIACISVSIFLLSSVSLSGQESAGKLNGTWNMKPEGSNLSFEFSSREKNGEGSSNTSAIFKKSELTGFSTGNDISFSVKKPGGEIVMKGNVSEGWGRRHIYIYSVGTALSNQLKIKVLKI